MNSLRIVALCRDWRMSDAEKYMDEGHPEFQVAVLPQRLWNLARPTTGYSARALHRERQLPPRAAALHARGGGRSRAAGR